LTKTLVELHGGRLDIASVPGRGTTVTVTFPPSRSLAPAEAAVQAAK
jgi:signal transduction histidine kinase